MEQEQEQEHPPRIIGNGMVSRSIFVPANGTKPGHFIPRGSTPGARRFRRQPPAPLRNAGASSPCEEKDHLPDPASAVHNIAPQMLHRHEVSSSNRMLSNEMTPAGLSAFTAAYTPPFWYTHQQQQWTTSVDPPSWHPHKPPGRRLCPSLGPPFLHWKQLYWGIDFYIRIDHAGCYHIYPHVGGPFKTRDEAAEGIRRYLHDRRDPKMFTEDNVSPVDIAVRQCLYWPDGTRKKRLRSEPVDEIRDRQRQLVLALVDKFNEDNHLSGDLAYALKDVVCYQSIFEGDIHNCYHHINFTAKPEGAVCYSLFFAEVIFLEGESEELPVSCLCSLKSADNGHCFGCQNNGNVDMKHPTDVGYAGGHVMNTFFPFSGPRIPAGFFDDDDNLEAQEATLRRGLQCLNDPHRMKRMRNTLPGSKAKEITGHHNVDISKQ